MCAPTDGLTVTGQSPRLSHSTTARHANGRASEAVSDSAPGSTFRRVSHGASLVSVSVEAIVDAVVKRASGDNMLPTNDELARQLGVSRTVLREALNQLVARRILDPRMNIGTQILDERQWQIIDRNVVLWRHARGTDPSLTRDLATIRRLVEPYAAADGAANADNDARARVLAACDLRLARPGRTPYLAACRELHLAVVAASTNQVVQQFGCFIDLPEPVASGARTQLPDEPHDVSAAEAGTVVALRAAFSGHHADAAHAAMTALLDWDLSPMEASYA